MSLRDHRKTPTSKWDEAQEARHLVHCPHLAHPSPAAAGTANNGHHKHVEHEVRLSPCPPSMPKNWCRTASNGHTQAGATPPQSLPLCHACRRTHSTRPATSQAPGKRASSPRAKCPRVQDSALETCDPAVVIFRYHCAGSSLTPSFTSHVLLKGQDMTGY